MYHFISYLPEIEKIPFLSAFYSIHILGTLVAATFFIWDTFKYVTSTGLVQLPVTHVWGKTIRGLEIPRH